MRAALPPLIFALGFSWRKRALVRQFFGASKLRFVRRAKLVPAGAAVAVWASGPFGTGALSEGPDPQFTRLFVEDGFLRSVGLGADLVRPLSWVIDRRGIYYDASQPSDLEVLLQTRSFDALTLQRAASLRESLVSSGLTKYNVGTKYWSRPALAIDLQVVLVPGQVETDASLRFGAPAIATNLELLKAARSSHPDAWVIYKPHPDVLAGLRAKGAQEDLAFQWCDEIVTDVSMGSLLQAVDVVHVLTSLAGFEALLRGKRVVCHGLPFYAGWGLTTDVLPIQRRMRKLDIDQLVAGVLLEYPLYLSLETGQLCQAEQALVELMAWKNASAGGESFWRKMMRPFVKRP
jgi:capsular polysaccharide export protein